MTALRAVAPRRRRHEPPPSSMVDVLRRRALDTPDAVAFLWLENGEAETEQLTFAELDGRARTIAGALVAAELGGGPVLLAYPPGLELIVALFGCFHAGLAAVVTPPPSSASFDRLRQLMSESAAAAVLTPRSHAERLAAELPACARILAMDTGATGGSFERVDVNTRSLAMIQYTSGSTASPRGVMLNHANLLANLQSQARATRILGGETALSWLPFHHDMGLFGFGLFPVYAGLRCVLMPPVAFLKRPARWVEAISRHGAALSAGPSFAYDLCARRTKPEQRAELDLSCWRVAVCGGEVVRPAVLEGFADTFAPAGFRRSALAPAYGLAEATLLTTSVRAEEGFTVIPVDGRALARGRVAASSTTDDERRLVACGHPWPRHQVVVVDPDRRTQRPEGEVGEVWVRGPSVSSGYWRRPGDTATVFDAELEGAGASGGWLRTGDLGFVCEAGLVVTGRRKDMIIVHGANIDPLDVELAAEASHPALAAGGASAFSFDNGDGEKVVIASEVERAALRTLDPAPIVTSVAAAMSLKLGFTLHDLVLLKTGELPRTSSGKVQRHLCRSRYLSGELVGLPIGRHPELGRHRASPQ